MGWRFTRRQNSRDVRLGAQDREEKKGMEESAGFWPEQLRDQPRHTVLGRCSPAAHSRPLQCSSLRHKANSLALWFKTSWPCLRPPSLTFQARMLPDCRLRLTHPKRPALRFRYVQIPGISAQAMENATCPTKTPLALPAGRNRAPAALLRSLAVPCSASVCNLGTDIHVSGLWLKCKLQRDRYVFHSYVYISPRPVPSRTYWIPYVWWALKFLLKYLRRQEELYVSLNEKAGFLLF